MADTHRALKSPAHRRRDKRREAEPETRSKTSLDDGYESVPTGTNWLIRRSNGPEGAARTFASGLAGEPGKDVVVVDLPQHFDTGVLEGVATVMPVNSPELHIVFGRPIPEEVGIGSWLAQRLNKPVTIADGHPSPATGGRLFIGAGKGRGWVRHTPDGGKRVISRRFPRPPWEEHLRHAQLITGTTAVVEQTPFGFWIRPPMDEWQLSAYRSQLAAESSVSLHILAVVVGIPGEAVPDSSAVDHFWDSLPAVVRPSVRFMEIRIPRSGDAHPASTLRAGRLAPSRAIRHGSSPDDPESGTAPSPEVEISTTPIAAPRRPVRDQGDAEEPSWRPPDPAAACAQLLHAGWPAAGLPVLERAALFVRDLLTRRPDLRRGVDALGFADLVALRVFLTRRQADDFLSGPRWDQLAMSLDRAIRRFPVYSGTTGFGVHLPSVGGHPYVEGRIITEPAPQMTYLMGREPRDKQTEFLIWSSSGRHVALLRPDIPDQVVFAPGTRFKVLQVQDGDKVVLLREVSPDEGRSTAIGLDKRAQHALHQARRERARDLATGLYAPTSDDGIVQPPGYAPSVAGAFGTVSSREAGRPAPPLPEGGAVAARSHNAACGDDR